ncbi:MAG: hypothetical protein ACP5E3_01075, partial [Bacteroidales bacterium]
MKISVTGFEIIEGNHAAEQAENFMSLFDGFIQQRSLKSEYIIAINFFIFTANNEAYQQHIQELKKQLPEYIRNNIPLTILAHAPASGKKISAELWYIEDPGDVIFSNRITGGNIYRVIQAGKEKLVISGGIESNTRAGNISEAAEKVFQCMDEILIAEGLNFSNIIRQWNYIENITAVDKDDGHSYQHYQQFNNIRSQYYDGTAFKYGYPAATGIGIKSGGVIVSFFAASEKFFSITSLENSLQKSAFEYSREVLIGDKEYRGCTKCPPKFSRAKSIVRGNSEQILISGTASIRGQ